MPSKNSYIYNFTLNFIRVQMVVNLFTLPILTFWGLPISIMSPIGNLLFAPALTAFLLTSTTIFFLEILHLPNQWGIYIIEKIVYIWTKGLTFGSKSWLIGFPAHCKIILISLPFLALAIQNIRWANTLAKKVIALTSLNIAAIILLKILVPFFNPTQEFQISCGKASAKIIHINGQIALIDCNAFCQNSCTESWIEYTLLPEIIKNTGLAKIDYVILTTPSKASLKKLKILCQKMKIGKIYIPFVKNNWTIINELKQLEEEANKNQIALHFLNKYPTTLKLDHQKIIITPGDKTKIKNFIEFRPVHISLCIDKDNMTLYDLSYSGRLK
ncbi:MAG: hypothetical protein UR26_C0001G0156 [candidate division TM6 bacterium GW2011_GWF2_32_72]|nr:MAG: hypothetical protein UR26_C0001G0156 [candidate division TM6 bacterium GW2011_GWF2_32_72]